MESQAVCFFLHRELGHSGPSVKRGTHAGLFRLLAPLGRQRNEARQAEPAD